MAFAKILEELRDKAVFITGGTGFFGKNLLSLFQQTKQAGLNIRVGVLSRNAERFQKDFPQLSEGVTFHHGDIESFEFPKENYDYIIHAATHVAGRQHNQDPAFMLNNMIVGIQRVLDFAESCGTKRILHTSSGAVYGEQPRELYHIPENNCWSPYTSDVKSAYGEGKRVSEMLGTLFSKRTGIEFVNARCFAFLGPYLPLDSNYAIGNFILNGLRDENIIIKGDGTPRRSYMYATDLVEWLLTILIFGENTQSYNVGSDIDYSIKEVAEKVKEFFPKIKIETQSTLKFKDKPLRYVPSIEKAKNDLGLKVNVQISDGIDRFLLNYKKKGV
jgi:nucleoside-diphosphate-sugar epimerase